MNDLEHKALKRFPSEASRPFRTLDRWQESGYLTRARGGESEIRDPGMPGCNISLSQNWDYYI
ncbi:hypothetical protein [Paeniglutamicibacter kerguelensis]|uniref:Uncharacterized protein n=1 Tax=Paeniglutamicibacter kerguelensis TaxID=254788 RepID=A0ABS4X8S1_9MICC|nr:hypothetical protein [Paeniglutamicibacter kerguelensis]MBP2384701.1 hypothetical protein [Paeniglutamicibacter kerguelensis]